VLLDGHAMTLKSLLENRLIARLVVFITLAALISLSRTLWTRWNAPKNSLDNSQLEALKAQEAALKQDIASESNPFFKEKIIRDELNMSKEGELILQIPTMPTPTPFPTLQPTPSPQVYQKWLNAI
jgi:cell division protein FtsB